MISLRKPKSLNVLFVCMGNICRSPTAHGVFQKMIEDDGLADRIGVDSAGTYAYHVGKKPDSRAISTAKKRGYELSKLRARKISDDDFENFDYILAMDEENLNDLTAQSDEDYSDKIKLLLEYSNSASSLEVPDPYYGGMQGFEIVLDLVEDASRSLLEHIKEMHFTKPS